MHRETAGPPGFTVLELLVVLAAVAGLVAIGVSHLRSLTRAGARNPLQCQENLRIIGSSLLLFAADHEDLLPWQSPAARGGSLELLPSGQTSPHFRTLRPYIMNTHVLVCPMDPMRRAGSGMDSLQDASLGYFLNVSASLVGRQAPWTGDRTVSQSSDGMTGEIRVDGKSVLEWTSPAPDQPGHVLPQTHEPTGNLLFGNQTLIETTTPQLRQLIRSLGTRPQRFLLP